MGNRGREGGIGRGGRGRGGSDDKVTLTNLLLVILNITGTSLVVTGGFRPIREN